MADDTSTIAAAGYGAGIGSGLSILTALLAPEIFGPIALVEVLGWGAVGAGVGAGVDAFYSNPATSLLVTAAIVGVIIVAYKATP